MWIVEFRASPINTTQIDEATPCEHLTAELGPVTDYAVGRYHGGHSNETLSITWDYQREYLKNYSGGGRGLVAAWAAAGGGNPMADGRYPNWV